MSEPSPSPSSSAEALYARALGKGSRDETPDVDALCAAHPRLAGELRELHEDWLRVQGVMSRLGVYLFRDDEDSRRSESFVGVVEALRLSSTARSPEEIRGRARRWGLIE